MSYSVLKFYCSTWKSPLRVPFAVLSISVHLREGRTENSNFVAGPFLEQSFSLPRARGVLGLLVHCLTEIVRNPFEEFENIVEASRVSEIEATFG